MMKGNSSGLNERPKVGEELEELELLVAALAQALLGLREEHGTLGLHCVLERHVLCQELLQLLHHLQPREALEEEVSHRLEHLLRRLGGPATGQQLPCLGIGNGAKDLNQRVLVHLVVDLDGCLEHRYSTPHISLGEEDQLFKCAWAHRHFLLFTDVEESGFLELGTHQLKPELGASRMQGLDDLGHIIANDDEARDMHELLHDPSQSCLSIMRHGIGFVQNDDPEARFRLGEALAADGQLRKGLHLFSDGRDPALV
mmetsp:Transcript_122564/g.291369  ORF Transcript_122564/g.291369 Transcript_122564/m.291369 type:complete len:257 (-) Transcript_122564:289-1059(-)